MTKIEITKRATLRDLEAHLSHFTAAQDPSAVVLLPRDIGSQFFKDCLLVALLTTLGRHANLSVKDWIQASGWHEEDASRRFGTTLEGLASLVYAQSIGNVSDDSVPLDQENLLWGVIRRKGIAEGEQGRGKSLTFCAFDARASRPLAFSDLNSKTKFIEELVRYRRNYFEKGIGHRYSENVDPEADNQLGVFVYELFQNTFEHGRLDRDNTVISGLRYIRLKKHIAYERGQFLRFAEGFTELEKYIYSQVPPTGEFKFYEISIGDQGLGILNRFRATRTDLEATVETDSVELLNQIVDQALSSKRSRAGAGYGLRNALRAVHQLGGFLSLRTEALWLYNTSSIRDKWRIRRVANSAELAPVEGTHFSMLFPLASR